ncbi:MAG: hypothetical protein J0H98_08120 [Solirubrobacterales bacterium]|nr:hypothetical protein [Solirubrobacterales bacterium]
MTEVLANYLIRRIEKPGQSWPLDDERDAHKTVLKWAAFRESDKDALRKIADWESDRDYRVDSLAERISDAYASMLFGEDVRATPGKPADADRLNALIAGPAGQDDAGFNAELQGGEAICSSEGEVWWRLYGNRAVSDHPLIEFHSREVVVPHFIGHRLVAAAFVSEFLGPDTSDAGNEKRTVWRHFEIHTTGRVENRLYRGTKDRIGQRVDLTQHVETEDLEEVWDHELPGMLCGRIPNKLGRDRRLGLSDYRNIEDYLLDLNETVTIGKENAKLTLKKRIVVPESSLKARSRPQTVDMGDGTRQVVEPRPAFDASEDVFVDTGGLDGDLGSSESGPYKVLEYSFDAEALIAYKADLVSSALSRAGIMPQFVGATAGAEGTADTGVALRVRLLPTTSAAKGKSRYWDAAIPQMLLLAQLLDSLPVESGGFGVEWAAAGEAPTVGRTDPLPTDQTELAARHVALYGADLESLQTALQDLHPDWTDDQVKEEVALIEAARPAPMTFTDLPTDPNDEPSEGETEPGSIDEPPA